MGRGATKLVAGPLAAGSLLRPQPYTPAMFNFACFAPGTRNPPSVARILLSAALASGCSAGSSLQVTLDELVAEDPSVPGAVLVVRHPVLDFDGVAGARSLDVDAPAMALDDPFRAASVTKTFVSVALLRQQEEGAIDLDDALTVVLSADSVTALEGGGYDPSAITLRQLLNHTAGIFDYTELDSYYATTDADPSHRWTRAEQLQLAMDEGEPLHEPGEAYAYGDTHYILAGEALERSTGETLAESLRQTLDFAGLGLTGTWLESLEDPPDTAAPDRLGHPYNSEVDTYGWDPSWDLYGGGGLVTTAGDLVSFFDAMFGGGIFTEAGTMDELLDLPEAGYGEFLGMDGGLGINRFVTEGTECWGGYGFFSTEVVYCPTLELTWAATLNQSDPIDPDAITRAVLEAAR